MKIAIIVCYFGKIPDYFKIWEHTCKYNEKVDFYLFTDVDIYSDAKNIKILKMKLRDIEKIAKEKLKLKANISTPYKLCDFKPVYGKIFEDYLKEYDFWGYCDLDQIFGNIEDFITDDILNKYDKIQKLGHLTLYRNNKKMNCLYTQKGAIYNYKQVLSKKEYFAFDEMTGINKITKLNNIKLYDSIKIADIDPRYTRFKICNEMNYKNQLFYWENGKIIRAYIDKDNNIRTDEFCYLHFQKKNPKIQIKIEKDLKSFFISQKGILNKKKLGIPTKEEIIKLAPYEGEKFEKIERKKYILKKLKQFFKCSYKQKKIWLKQKIFI